MSFMLNGARYAVATQLAAAVAITAVSNAEPPVATSASPPADGSVILLQSGWSGIDGQVVRSDGATANTFELDGLDTTEVVRFPAGEGIGTFQIASGWQNLPKIHDIQESGGDPNFSTPRQYVDDPNGAQIQVPTGTSPRTTTFLMDYQPELPHFNALVELSRVRDQIRIIRETLTNGDTIYYAGYLFFDKRSTKALNEFLSNRLIFTEVGEALRYDAA